MRMAVVPVQRPHPARRSKIITHPVLVCVDRKGLGRRHACRRSRRRMGKCRRGCSGRRPCARGGKKFAWVGKKPRFNLSCIAIIRLSVSCFCNIQLAYLPARPISASPSLPMPCLPHNPIRITAASNSNKIASITKAKPRPTPEECCAARAATRFSSACCAARNFSLS